MIPVFRGLQKANEEGTAHQGLKYFSYTYWAEPSFDAITMIQSH